MAPSLPDGTYALFRITRNVQTDDTVLVDHPRFGLIVKDVSAISEAGLELQGRDTRSTPTDLLGVVTQSRILGRLVWVLSKPQPPPMLTT